ncbi:MULTISPECIES: GNAT family N-acetyltransferase [Mesobacillus]|uniref:GNAT family N-acetyltransferase n=1 Tax=Mesobacillus selenatarsenatis TaxID=388741 RepID=A0A846TLX5_9BACI|nr:MULTISPECIES: GNAT family N-acetyltransferase [Mesobacillus]NKE07779.1 GNAT family N-acetyltransferase [Mesobacillus selenatarsenatis]
MSLSKSSEIKLRDMKVPEDYEQLTSLLNMIDPGSTTAQSIEEEDRQIPTVSNLKMNEDGLLAGFGRTRVVAEDDKGQIIGYGASFRAPWVEPGNLGSVFCVHPDFRRKGIGGKILAHLENWANEHHASVLSSIVMDWIDDSLPFVQNRGFVVDAHIFDLELDLNQFNNAKYGDTVEQVIQSGIQLTTLADLTRVETETELYELCVETAKDNPGQYSSLPPFEQWRKEFLPEANSRKEWVFLAIDGDRLIGVSQLFSTEDEGVLYTNYTGILKEYRGRGIAKALKLRSIEAAMKAGAHTLTTDSEEKNAPMQLINRSLGYIPGKGHYRILKKLRK